VNDQFEGLWKGDVMACLRPIIEFTDRDRKIMKKKNCGQYSWALAEI
jgi:hypothetical protein